MAAEVVGRRRAPGELLSSGPAGSCSSVYCFGLDGGR